MVHVVNLGCPTYHLGTLCVDRKPKDEFVMKADVESFVWSTDWRFDHIYSKNLLEHLPDVGLFLKGCNRILYSGGKIQVITDNAEFVPFYAPLWVKHTGIGAHANNKYAIDHCDSVHYAVFTKMHLRNLFEYAGFKVGYCMRTWGGARLEIGAVKP